MTAHLVGLVAPQGAGKDTFAGYLSDQGFAWAAFAQPIRNMLCELFCTNLAGLEDLKRSEIAIPGLGPRTYRYIAQTLGTEWGRKMVHPDIWVNWLEEHIYDPDEDLVISDVRMQNEAAWIKSKGGILVSIERPGSTWKHDHASEFGHLIRTDYTIYNDDSLAVLQERAESFATLLRAKERQ
jgi:hypothetical protein